jgi:hypothetical protein
MYITHIRVLDLAGVAFCLLEALVGCSGTRGHDRMIVGLQLNNRDSECSWSGCDVRAATVGK